MLQSGSFSFRGNVSKTSAHDLNAGRIRSVLSFMISLAICFKDFRNLLNRVPIAVGGRHAEELLDLAEITDRFHLPSIKAQNESVLNRNDLEQPVVIGGQTERKLRRRGEAFSENVYEPGYVRVRGLF